MPLFTAALLALLACDGKNVEPMDGGDDTAGDDTALSTEDNDGDGYSPADGDCNDEDETIHPTAIEEACDGVDQNCDGVELDDIDGDGYLCEGAGGDDCDDFDPAVNPGAEDYCGDGVDVNCDLDAECDCDGDSHVSADYGGDDCDDSDYRNYPGAVETCYDGMDNDCDASTLDCDCDLDGVEDASCGGGDCDDDDPTVYEGATEAYADNLDNDCDDEVDEGAYCNLYAPLTNVTTGANKEYDVFYDGSYLTEVVTPTSYDPTTGAAVLTRDWTGKLAYTFTEYWDCDGEVSLTGWDLGLSGIPFLSLSFGSPRTDLLIEDEMVAEVSWDYRYIAQDLALGLGDFWEATGTIEVIGEDTWTTAAGTFDVLHVTNTYTLVMTNDLFSLYGLSSRSGVVQMYYAERLGLVYSEDVTDEGAVIETRELTSYTEFYP
jgi:hypothetical protein